MPNKHTFARCALLLTSASAFAMIAPNAQAQVIQWIGGDGLWEDAASWTPSTVPTTADDAMIAEGGVEITDEAFVNRLSLTRSAGTNESASLFVTGADAILTANAQIIVGSSAAPGVETFNQAYVLVTDGAQIITPRIDFGAYNTGAVGFLTIDASTLTADQFYVNYGNVAATGGAQIETRIATIGRQDIGYASVSEDGTVFTSTELLVIGGSAAPPSSASMFSVYDGGRVSANALELGVGQGIGVLEIYDGVVEASSVIIGKDGLGGILMGEGASFISTGPVVIAQGVDSLGIIYLGNPAVMTPHAPVTFEAPSIEFGAGGAQVIFLHNSDNYAFSPDLIGGDNAVLYFGAGTTRLTGDTSAFTGYAFVDQDVELSLSGAFGGDVEVVGGVLSGVGGVRDLWVEGGTFAPGAFGAGSTTPVTFSADSVYLGPGAVYEVDVNAAGAGDRLNVAGDVEIDGAVVYANANASGTYRMLTDYTIIDADTVTGEFDSVSTNLAFLDPSLRYANGQVVLRMIRNDVALGDVADTPNQDSIAGAIDTLGESGNPLWEEIIGQSEDGARASFNSLSGDLHASVNANFFDIFHMAGFADRRLHHIAQSVEPVQLASLEPMAGEGRRSAGVWLEAYGGKSTIDGDANAAGLESSRQGVLIGGDIPLGNAFSIGAAIGQRSSESDQDDRASSADIDATDIFVYAGGVAGALSFSGVIGQTQKDVSTERNVTVGAINQTLTADYSADATFAQARIGYRFAFGAASLEPYAAVSAIQFEQDSFSETGGSAALNVGASSEDVTVTEFGVRGVFEASDNLRLHGALGVRNDDGEPTTTQMSFVSDADAAFVVRGVTRGDTATTLAAGADWGVGDALTLSAGYQGAISDAADDHAVSVRLTWRPGR